MYYTDAGTCNTLYTDWLCIANSSCKASIGGREGKGKRQDRKIITLNNIINLKNKSNQFNVS